MTMANRPPHYHTFNGSADFHRDDFSRPLDAPEGHLDLWLSSSDLRDVAEDVNQYNASEILHGTEDTFGVARSSARTTSIIDEFFDFDLYSRSGEATITTATSFERDCLPPSIPSVTGYQDMWITLDDQSQASEGTIITPAFDPLANPFVNQPTRGEDLNPQLYPTSEDIDAHLSDPNGQDVDESQSSSRSHHGKQAPKRTLQNPEETALTREKKACLSCKIQKIRCNPKGDCPSCVAFSNKVGSPVTVCNRTILTMIRKKTDWPLTDHVLRMPTREHSWSIGNRVPLLISRYTNAGNASLSVYGCAFTDLRPNLSSNRLVGFAPGEGPSDEDLYSWAKRDIKQRAETHKNFSNCLEKFHMLYEQMLYQRYVYNVKGSYRTRPGQFHRLIDNTQHVACMVKIWAAEQFSVVGVSNDADAEPVSVFLHRRAGKMIGPGEKQILEQLKTFTNPKETKITNDLESTLGSALAIAVWTALWQMMLTYRSVLKQMLPGTAFHEETSELFESMVTIYSTLFRKAEVLRTVEKAIDDPNAFDTDQVWQAFREAWTTRDGFYREVESGSSSNIQDALLKSHVVTWERVILNRRATKPTRKGKASGKR